MTRLSHGVAMQRADEPNADAGGGQVTDTADVARRSSARHRYERTRTWLVGADPGLIRLRTATRTSLTLGVTLLVLSLLATVAGQPLTVALLGVVIAMLSAMAVNDPDPRQQNITMALLPVPAAAAVSLGAVLSPHLIAGDITFVLIMFAAVYVRRFGGRGMALGMVAFMTYFFALFLRATVSQLPWLIGAVVVGTACSFCIRTYVLPVRPERVLRRTLRALWARAGALVDATSAALQAGNFDEPHQHRLRRRATQLNQTALMVEDQLDDNVDAAMLWPGVDDDLLTVRLFDAELAAERLATAGGVAAAAADIRMETRNELLDVLGLLRVALSNPSRAQLDQVQHRAEQMLHQRAAAPGDAEPLSIPAYRLALAIVAMAEATRQAWALADPAPGTPSPEANSPGREQAGRADDDPGSSGAAGEPDEDADPNTSWSDRLRPTTRQAIQVAVAASWAIVAGEYVSPARWYWAVIAAFVIFSGTTSRGEIISKGWQRLLGTALGVPAGVLVASAVGGDTALALVLIFVCMFLAFYLMKVAYSLMAFWITTMLALLYGLLGQFSVSVLLVRIEETAVGAVIGVAAAVLVLPTSTRTTVRKAADTFLTTLEELVEAAAQILLDEQDGQDLTEQARDLGQQLQQLRSSAAPLTIGLAGLSGRGSTRRAVRVLTACDHYARSLAQSSSSRARLAEPRLPDTIRPAVDRIKSNIRGLVSALSGAEPSSVQPAADLLDAAEKTLTDQGDAPSPHGEQSALRDALHALQHLDQAVVGLARELGAGPR